MSVAAPRRGRRRGYRGEALAAAAFLLPALVLLVLLRIAPAAVSVVDSLHRRLPGSFLPPEWVGLDNYAQLLGSSGFWLSVRQTLLFAVIVNPLSVIGALLLAQLLTRTLYLRGFWRVVAFLPSALPLMGVTVVFSVLLRPDGAVNGLLGFVGIPAQPWFTSSGGVLPALALLASWAAVGYWMIFLINGINDIDPDCYEAASVDGAGPVRQFFSITLPLLRRPLFFVLVASTVWNFVVYAPIQAITRGGPEGASNLLMYDVVNRYYQLSSPGTAMAQMVLLFVIMGAIVVAQFAVMRRMEEDRP